MNKLIKRRLLIEKSFPKSKLERIQMVYNNIKNKYNSKINNQDTRKELTADLSEELGAEFLIVCDQRNNTPEVIALNYTVASICYDQSFLTGYFKHIDLMFGPNVDLKLIAINEENNE